MKNKKNELLQYIGNRAQLGGTRHYNLSDGPALNMRAIDVNTGAGLTYTTLPDRGMDISFASFRVTNLAFLTPNGETHPAFYEPQGIGWLRTFTGGLLTTWVLPGLALRLRTETKSLDCMEGIQQYLQSL